MSNAFLDGLKSFGHDITDSLGLTSYNNGQTAKGWDQLKNGQTNTVNQQIAEQNLAFQRENFEYQKALQQKIFDREDSAYQRTVADMRQAGLSPLMMNGTNGAGEAIQTEPLHNDFQMQDKGVLQVASEAVQMLSGLQGVKRQILENDYLNKTLDDRVNFQKFQTLLSEYEQSDGSRREKFDKYFGIYKDMPEKQKFMNILLKTFGVDPTNMDNYNSDNFSKVFGDFQNGVSSFFSNVVGGIFDNASNKSENIGSKIVDSLSSAVDSYIDEINPGYSARKGAKKAQKKVEQSKKDGSYKKYRVEKNDNEIVRWR